MPRIDTATEPPIKPIDLVPIGAPGWQSYQFVRNDDAQSLVNTDFLALLYTRAHQHAETCEDGGCAMRDPQVGVKGMVGAVLSMPPSLIPADEVGAASGGSVSALVALLSLRSMAAGYYGIVNTQTVHHMLRTIGHRGESGSPVCLVHADDIRRLRVLVMLETVFGPLRSGPIREDIKRRARHALNDTDQPIEVRAAAMRAVCRMHYERSVWTTDTAEARLIIGHHPTFGRYARAYDGAAIRAYPDVLAAFRAVYPLEPSPFMPAGKSYWSTDVA